MLVAIVGCSHGELDNIYAAIEHAEEQVHQKVDLLICCGDFQSVRNVGDLKCMAVPTKYMHMQSFYRYYKGQCSAPVLTIFVGGNHEASNYLQELPFGGWVAPNIYYLGYAGVVNVGGLRIGGISGIYKGCDFLKGRCEKPPYNNSSIRSVYHVRNLEVLRFKQLRQDDPLDIFLSHDWPRNITSFGDVEALKRIKPFFTDEINKGTLGSRPAEELLEHLKPRYWFSGHLHVKFAALIDHNVKHDNQKDKECNSTAVHCPTKFLALDKCLPNRHFLQLLNIKHGHHHKYQNLRISGLSEEDESKLGIHKSCVYATYDLDRNVQLFHDLEWLTVLRLTDNLQSVTSNSVYLPGPGGTEPYQFTPTTEQIKETLELMGYDLQIKPQEFKCTADAFDPAKDAFALNNLDTIPQPEPVLNPYTASLCDRLCINDPLAVLLKGMKGSHSLSNFFLTPKRLPSSADKNVTLDESRLSHVEDSDGESPCKAASSDIVFEISLETNDDGIVEGTLSPLVTPQRITSNADARKKLMLTSPYLDDKPEVMNPSSTSETYPQKSTQPLLESQQLFIGSASSSSSGDESPHLQCSIFSTPLAVTAPPSRAPLRLSQPVVATGGSQDLARIQLNTKDNNPNTERPVLTVEGKSSESEERLLEGLEMSIDNCGSSKAPNTKDLTNTKKLKFKRRNAAIYENDE